MKAKNVNEKVLTFDYINNRMSLPDICKKYKIGKIRARKIIIKNGGIIRDCHEKRIIRNFIIDDYRIKKYLNTDKFYYVAILKTNKDIVFYDTENFGGYLTSYIEKELGIEVPTLYDRRIYYQTTGDYWWEQWFDVEKRNKVVKKCPYCDWETIDIDNKSGAFEIHLKRMHGINKLDYIKNFPEERNYFTLANKTHDKQLSLNPDEYVTCAICGRKLSRIDHKHLIKHNITQDEYMVMYDNKTVSNNLHNKLSEIATENNMNITPQFHSKPELEIMDYIKSMGYECKSDRKILNGKEIDIFIPLLNIGIEFNGNFYHTELRGGKDKYYHVNKTIKAQEKGINLIQIFEDEYYNKKEIVYNELYKILNKKYDRNINIDSFEIKIVSHDEADDFIQQYNINPPCKTSIHYGAFYNNKLLVVMSFLKLNTNKWKLYEITNVDNNQLCDICNKIFNKFIIDNNPQLIVSFLDRRWATNFSKNILNSLGFVFTNYTKPEFSIYNRKVNKYKRFKINEIKEDVNNDKVWDCGQIKYVWKNKNGLD